MSKKMANKTKKAWLKQCNNDKLYREIFKRGKVSWSEFKESPRQYSAADSGAVTGVIRYTDNVIFGKKWFNEAYQLAAAGNYPKDYFLDDYDGSIDYNKVTWFLWETMAADLINYLED